MKKERIRCIPSGLKRFELTGAETQLICLAEQNLNWPGLVIKKIEPILERIYSQKTQFIKNSIFYLLNQEQERRFSYGLMKTHLARKTTGLTTRS